MAAPPLTSLAAAVLHVRPPPERALVLECGDGDAVLFLAREFPVARVRGIDSNPRRVREASARVGLDPEGRVAFKLGGPRAIPYPDAFFDLLVAVDTWPSAREALRVLLPGGYLVLARSAAAPRVPGLTTLWRRRQLARADLDAVATADAGDGSFSVHRLPSRGRSALPI